MTTSAPQAGHWVVRPAYSARACICLPHSQAKRTMPAGGAGGAGARLGAAAAPLLGTVVASPQPGHLTRRPAYSSGTRSCLPQEHENDTGMIHSPRRTALAGRLTEQDGSL